MRYYFNVLNDSDADEVGLELNGLGDVKRHAFHHARDILADHHVCNSLCETLSMVVTDELG